MDHLQLLIERYPQLEPLKHDINAAFTIIAESFSNDGKLLIAGNGGSAADSEHIVGELMKNFGKKRILPDIFVSSIKKVDFESAQYLVDCLQPCFPAIALSCHASLNTAIINDIDSDIVFAQQVYGYGNAGDVFLGISTSGNSKNVSYAMITAKAKNMKTIALSGSSGGILLKHADIAIVVPEKETFKIQELHLPIYHALCLMIEEHFFP